MASLASCGKMPIQNYSVTSKRRRERHSTSWRRLSRLIGNNQRLHGLSLKRSGRDANNESYSLSEMSLSYNGGKDCLVLLVLYLHALYEHHLRCINLDQSTTTSQQAETQLHFQSIQSVYIKSPHPFSEVEAFVEYSERIYSLSLQRYVTPMKAAFASYLADNPCVRAIFVGTRRTDPHGLALTHFDMTDRGWPEFMRIHPVIDWHYVEIWSVGRLFAWLDMC